MRKNIILIASVLTIVGCGGGNTTNSMGNSDLNNQNSNYNSRLYDINSSNYNRATSVCFASLDDIQKQIDLEKINKILDNNCTQGSYTKDNSLYTFNNCKVDENYSINGSFEYNNETFKFNKGNVTVKNHLQITTFKSGEYTLRQPYDRIQSIKNLNVSAKYKSHFIEVENLNFEKVENNNNKKIDISAKSSSDIIDSKWIDIGYTSVNNKIIIKINGKDNSNIILDHNDTTNTTTIKVNNQEMLKDKNETQKMKTLDKRNYYFDYTK